MGNLMQIARDRGANELVIRFFTQNDALIRALSFRWTVVPDPNAPPFNFFIRIPLR